MLETERTWDYLEPSEEKYRPQIRSTPGNPRQSWVIDGKIAGFRFPTLSERELKAMSEKPAGMSKHRRPLASWTMSSCDLGIWMS